jgi:hypothetical protein
MDHVASVVGRDAPSYDQQRAALVDPRIASGFPPMQILVECPLHECRNRSVRFKRQPLMRLMVCGRT